MARAHDDAEIDSGFGWQRTGTITVNGNDVVTWPTHQIAHLGIGYCPEERGIYASLSCEENLMLPPKVRDGGMGIDEIYAMFPNLKERRTSQGTRLVRRRAADVGGGENFAYRRGIIAARRDHRRFGAGDR